MCHVGASTDPGCCLGEPVSLLLHGKMTVRDKHVWIKSTVICVVHLHTHRGKGGKSGQQKLLG